MLDKTIQVSEKTEIFEESIEGGYSKYNIFLSYEAYPEGKEGWLEVGIDGKASFLGRVNPANKKEWLITFDLTSNTPSVEFVNGLTLTDRFPDNFNKCDKLLNVREVASFKNKLYFKFAFGYVGKITVKVEGIR